MGWDHPHLEYGNLGWSIFLAFVWFGRTRTRIRTPLEPAAIGLDGEQVKNYLKSNY
jgi:hypothetical protein